MTEGSRFGAHDRSRRRLGAGALALAAWLALVGCSRQAVPPAAPFGGTLAQPLPHRDVLGFLAIDAADAVRLGGLQWKAGRADLVQEASVLQPIVAMLKLVGRHDVVPHGGCFALLFLDTDVHGGLAAYAWRGDVATLRAAAAAAQIPIDDAGRLLLPGRGRARDLDLLTDAMRHQRDRDDAALPSEVVMPAANGRHRETPRVPHWIVARDGVVLVLPSADGERNLFDTLDATRLLDIEPALRPCLRLAIGRVDDRFRGTLGGYLDMAIDQLMPTDYSRDFASLWRARTRARNTAEGLLDALCSIDELFVQRNGAVWQGYLRERAGSFGAALLDVVVNRPVAELLVDVPDTDEWIAGRFDPDAAQGVADRWERTRATGFHRMGGPRPPRLFSSNEDEDLRKEQESATAFFSSLTGRFWCAGRLDATHAATTHGGDPSFRAESIGSTQLATFFEHRPDVEPVGLFTTIVDTLVPKGWRNAIRLGSALVYRPAPLERGVLEVVAKEPDRVCRATIAAIEQGGVEPQPAAPAEAFFVLREQAGQFGLMAGDLYATRVGLGIALQFVPAAQ